MRADGQNLCDYLKYFEQAASEFDSQLRTAGVTDEDSRHIFMRLDMMRSERLTESQRTALFQSVTEFCNITRSRMHKAMRHLLNRIVQA